MSLCAVLWGCYGASWRSSPQNTPEEPYTPGASTRFSKPRARNGYAQVRHLSHHMPYLFHLLCSEWSNPASAMQVWRLSLAGVRIMLSMSAAMFAMKLKSVLLAKHIQRPIEYVSVCLRSLTYVARVSRQHISTKIF